MKFYLVRTIQNLVHDFAHRSSVRRVQYPVNDGGTASLIGLARARKIQNQSLYLFWQLSMQSHPQHFCVPRSSQVQTEQWPLSLQRQQQSSAAFLLLQHLQAATLKVNCIYITLQASLPSWVFFWNMHVVLAPRWHTVRAKADMEGPKRCAGELGPDSCQSMHLAPYHLQQRQLCHPCVCFSLLFLR